ncbi:claspin [Ciona intestinalis]
MFKKSSLPENDLKEDSDDENSSSGCSSDSSSDEDSPPLRIFRNPDAAARNDRGANLLDSEDDEEINVIPMSRKPKRPDNNFEIKSETQRLIRESRVNLPYFVPESKKLSDFMKRPVSLLDQQVKTEQKEEEIKLETDTADSGIGVAEKTENEEENLDEEVSSTQKFVSCSTPATQKMSKTAKLLAERGIVVPTLNVVSQVTSPAAGIIRLDDEVESTKPQNEVTNFMQRFLKHSKAGKRNLNKKKVHFDIIKKEERKDGSGVELVTEIVEFTDPSIEDSNDSKDLACVSHGEKYRRLREKLTKKMREKRCQERLKKEELYRLDNEELESEEEEADWSEGEIDSEQSEAEDTIEKSENSLKNPIIEDDEDSLENTQPVGSALNPEFTLSNDSLTSKTSQATSKSGILFPHLSTEGSMLLFEDSIKKSSMSHDDDAESPDHSYDNLYVSMIPPNQPALSDISDSSKPSKLHMDEDSYFCADRSSNASTNTSQFRPHYESQFLDSDGFIKEPKEIKPIDSLLPLGAEDDNANDYNMSQLLELCSGKFQDSTNPLPSDIENEVDQVNESFGFQVEAGKLKESEPVNFSDNDDKNGDSSDDDEGITIIRRKKDVEEKMTKNFLEDEAELSGDDVGSDDDDELGGDYYEEEENDEILPGENLMKKQVNKVHLKRMLDEDQHHIDLLQEALIDEVVDAKRNRKFRWKNIDENLTQDLFHSDDDDVDGCHDDDDVITTLEAANEESRWRKMRLEREEFLESKPENDQISEDSQLLTMGRSAIHKSRVLSEVNDQSQESPLLLRSNSVSLSNQHSNSQSSFMCRKPEVLSKFSAYKELKNIKGAVNSGKMVFTVGAENTNEKRKPTKSPGVPPLSKKPRMDEDSNSVFSLLETS